MMSLLLCLCCIVVVHKIDCGGCIHTYVDFLVNYSLRFAAAAAAQELTTYFFDLFTCAHAPRKIILYLNYMRSHTTSSSRNLCVWQLNHHYHYRRTQVEGYLNTENANRMR